MASSSTSVESVSAEITPNEREFVLQLLRDARLNGITELEYKGLKLRISPSAADNAQRTAYYATAQGKPPMSWEAIIPTAAPSR
jgi:hypothetical protein